MVDVLPRPLPKQMAAAVPYFRVALEPLVVAEQTLHALTKYKVPCPH